MRADEVAEQVVRSIRLEDGQMGVGLYVGEECRFVLPMRFVSGTDDTTRLVRDLRQIVVRACEMVMEDLDLC